MQVWKVNQRYQGSSLAGFCERGNCHRKAVALLSSDSAERSMQVCKDCERDMIDNAELIPCYPVTDSKKKKDKQ